MHFINSLISSAVVLGLTSQSMGASIKRQTPPSCAQSQVGYLTLVPSGATGPGPFTYAGIVPGDTHGGIDGHSDSLIVTKDNNGQPLTPQVWEFARCTDEDNDAIPGSYTGSSGPTSISFGILRPVNATQHCLALESEADSATGARNSVVDSYCTQVPVEFRTWMLIDEIYGDSDDGMKLYFQSKNTTVTIGGTAHAEIQFFTNEAKPGQAMQLVLAPLSA